MSITYTKKCVVELPSVEGQNAHETVNEYMDWYLDQLDKGLGDPVINWLPWKYIGLTCEMLCVNQSQAEELLALCNKIGEQLNYPFVSTSILDFSDTVESFDPDPLIFN